MLEVYRQHFKILSSILSTYRSPSFRFFHYNIVRKFDDRKHNDKRQPKQMNDHSIDEYTSQVLA